MQHLKFDLSTLPPEHPVTIMARLGITYTHATPQSIFNEWWFWNCEKLPDTLPGYLLPLNIDPLQYVGYGLSEKEAQEIVSKGQKQ